MLIFLILGLLSENSHAVTACIPALDDEVASFEKIASRTCSIVEQVAPATPPNQRDFDAIFDKNFALTNEALDARIKDAETKKEKANADYFRSVKAKIQRSQSLDRESLRKSCGGEGNQVTIAQTLPYTTDSGNHETFLTRGNERKSDNYIFNSLTRNDVNPGNYYTGGSTNLIRVGRYPQEKAQQLKASMETDDQIMRCALANGLDGLSEETYAPQVVSRFGGAANFFADNSAKISTNGEAALEKELKKDYSGFKKIKVKIMTCSSMVRNCPPGSASDSACGLIESMRGKTDAELIAAKETPAALKEILTKPEYGYTTGAANMKDATDPREQRLWLALSALRAAEMKKLVSKSVQHPNIEYELIPTGDPSDRFNNSRIDPSLAGTCGPRPAAGTDQYYGAKPGENACSMLSPVNEKVDAYYREQKDDLKTAYANFSGKKDPSTSDQFGMHRYGMVEIVGEGQKPAADAKKIKTFELSCYRRVLTCNVIKKPAITLKLPDLSIDWSFLKIFQGDSSPYGRVNRGRDLGCFKF